VLFVSGSYQNYQNGGCELSADRDRKGWGRLRVGGDVESVDVGCALNFLYTPQSNSVSIQTYHP
jgi:hypothetical protein